MERRRREREGERAHNSTKARQAEHTAFPVFIFISFFLVISSLSLNQMCIIGKPSSEDKKNKKGKIDVAMEIKEHTPKTRAHLADPCPPRVNPRADLLTSSPALCLPTREIELGPPPMCMSTGA